MKIAVMGAGSMGGYYGAKLIRGGHSVALIARGAHLEAIRGKGLKIIRDEETFTVTPWMATDNPAQAGEVELILVATKSYDLQGAARAIAPMVGKETMVLPLLNGVDIAERLGDALGMSHMLGGLTYLPGNMPEPGVVNQLGVEGRLEFGEFNDHHGNASGAGGESRADKLLKVFHAAGIVAEISGDIRTALWSKFVLINSTAGVCGVTGKPVGPVREDPRIRAMFTDCAAEVAALARKQGIHLDDDIIKRTLGHLDSVPYNNKPSLLQDLERGKPLELESLNGATVRLGKELGVPTPVNRFIYAALKGRADGEG